MARLLKVRTRGKPKETRLVEGGFSAARGGAHWLVRYPWRDTHRVNARMNQEQMRVLLQFIGVAYETGRQHTLRRIHEALGI